MSARIFCRFVILPLLVAEALAFFVADNKALGICLGVVAAGLLGLFLARGPQTAEDFEPCPPDCRKCAEDLEIDPDYRENEDR